MILDLNKCLGCHTCSIACKKMWNTKPGTDYAYWNSVETLPGKGYPANYPQIGGRTDKGEVKRGQIPNLDSGYGRSWSFNHKDALASTGQAVKVWIKPKEEVKWGAELQTKMSVKASTRKTTITSICPACATTARIRPARMPARAARLKSVSMTASCW